jgi:type III restriction enzyme
MQKVDLKEYQKNAVSLLIEKTRILLSKAGTKQCVLKAPTGSGKTIMAADYLDKLAHEKIQHDLSFLWISAHSLHEQSRKKIESYLHDSVYTFSYLEDVQDRVIKQNEIVFINWEEITKKDRETGQFSNIFMRENEQDRNLPTFIDNTIQEGREIVLIVDESHYHYWSPDSQRLVINTLKPKLILEVSATPRVEPTVEDVQNNEAGYVSIKFDVVVAEGMIKKEIVINEEFQHVQITDQSADEVVIETAIKKQEQLRKAFKKQNIAINPLILIQLPSQRLTTSVLDQAKIDVVKNILKDRHNITVENNRLGIWLSDEENKKNLDGIEEPDSTVDVLIFKQAIAIGWDCPRAHILVMFRETQNVIFEVQTVGRIMRMPEIRRYDEEILNKAYIYTNLAEIHIKQEVIDKGYFSHKVSRRKPDYEQLNLNSIYLHRTDYGDLTLSFRNAFISEANNYFSIKSSDLVNVAYDKVSKQLNLDTGTLTTPVMSDVVVANIDKIDTILGTTVDLPIAEEDIKEKFNYLTKALSLPFAPIRSYTKIQQSIYDWFDKYLGFRDRSRLDIQKIVLCSEDNQRKITEIIERAKQKFSAIKESEVRQKSRIKPNDKWNIPEIQYFNDLYVTANYDKYILDPAYFISGRSGVEVEFEQLLNSSQIVKWWYKNGEKSENYFGLLYEDSTKGAQATFYPDFIVRFIDDTVGIYDTKDGNTASAPETKDKAEALYKYIHSQKEPKLKGGIVIHNARGWFINNGTKYHYDESLEGWQSLEI